MLNTSLLLREHGVRPLRVHLDDVVRVETALGAGERVDVHVAAPPRPQRDQRLQLLAGDLFLGEREIDLLQVGDLADRLAELELFQRDFAQNVLHDRRIDVEPGGNGQCRIFGVSRTFVGGL